MRGADRLERTFSKSFLVDSRILFIKTSRGFNGRFSNLGTASTAVTFSQIHFVPSYRYL